jgi:hypothetical protein
VFTTIVVGHYSSSSLLQEPLMNASSRLHKAVLGLFVGIVLVACCQSASAALINLEPDHYAPGTDLDTIQPGITLGVFNTILNALEPPAITTVESVADPVTSTGTRVFGLNSLASWSDTRRLNMLFDVPTDFLSIDFIGNSSIAPMIGKLDIFNSMGTLLDTYTTDGLNLNEIESMSFTRMSPDVKFARAYTAPGSLPFGRLDNLSFNKLIAIPEPAAVCLVGIVLAFVHCIRHRTA